MIKKSDLKKLLAIAACFALSVGALETRDAARAQSLEQSLAIQTSEQADDPSVELFPPVSLGFIGKYEVLEIASYHFKHDNPSRHPVVTAVALSKDGSKVYVGGDDQRVYVSDPSEPKPKSSNFPENGVVAKPTKMFAEDWIRSIEFRPIPENANEMEITTLAQSGEIAVWNLAQERKSLTAPNAITGARMMDYSPNGNILAVCGYEPVVKLFESSTLKTPVVWTAPGASSGALQFSNGGTLLALGGRNGVARVWDTKQGRVKFDFVLTNIGDQQSRRIRALSFYPLRYEDSRDDKRTPELLAVAGDADQIVVWDLQSGAPVARSAIDSGKVYSLAFIDRNLIVYGTSLNQLVFWNIDDDEKLVLTPHTGTVSTIKYVESRNEILTGSFDATVKRFKLAPKGAN